MSPHQPQEGGTVKDERDGKDAWTTLSVRRARDISLPHPDIYGPMPDDGSGEECPWPWEPETKDVTLGQYHCGYCGSLVDAGVPHVDYAQITEQGRVKRP
jgi:hypothetical protein